MLPFLVFLPNRALQFEGALTGFAAPLSLLRTSGRQGFGTLSAADKAEALTVFGERLVRLRCAFAVLLSWHASRPDPHQIPSQAEEKAKVAAKEAAIAAKAAAKEAKAAARAKALLKKAADKEAKQAKKAAAADAKKAKAAKAATAASKKRAREAQPAESVPMAAEEAAEAPAPKKRARAPKAAAAAPAVGLRRSARTRR